MRHRKTRKIRKSNGFKSKDELAATRKSGGFKSKDELAATRKSGGFKSKDELAATRKSGGFLRPKPKGGFLPSIMGPFVQNASMLTPIAVAAGYRLVNNSKTLRKKRGKTRSKANLRRRR